jgi:hypothetical protein
MTLHPPRLRVMMFRIIVIFCIFFSTTTEVRGNELGATWLDVGIPDTSWYGDGTAQTFTIDTAEQLAGLSQLMNQPDAMQRTQGFKDKVIILNADIDLSGRTWIPIGQDVVYSGIFFKGTFLGNSHTIVGLSVRSATEAGLFNRLEDATIRSITLLQASVEGKTRLGSIASEAINSLIDDVHVSGTVQGFADTPAGLDFTGGLVGFFAQGIIKDSSFTGDVGGDKFVGGLIGAAYRAEEEIYSTLIAHSHFAGTLRAQSHVGGLVGTSINGVGIYDSSVRADIFADEEIAGGLVGGANNAAFDEVLFEGRIEAQAYIGGIAGYLENGAVRIAQIRANLTGSGSQSSEIGGVAGTAINSSMSEFVVEGNITGYQNVGGVVGVGETLEMDNFVVRTSIQATESGGLLAAYLTRSDVRNGNLTEATITSRIGNILIVASNNNTLRDVEHNATDTRETTQNANALPLVGVSLLIGLALIIGWTLYSKRKSKII